jgi:UDP-N-acetylmuramoyl-tripeptide--D-alanyl-D-alanine ligase
MKKTFKKLVAAILGSQLKRLRKKNKIFVIAVAGSIGKTSTKLALAHVLSQTYKVRYQEGNYNDLVTVPLVFFGRKLPNIYNPLAWFWVFFRNELTLSMKYPYHIVIVELGSDAPGQMKEFGMYLEADIGVLTAIVPEHMANFANLDAVAAEELAITNFTTKIFANKDLISPQYLGHLPNTTVTYGINQEADIRLTNINWNGGEEATFDIVYGGITFLHGEHEKVTEPQLYSICAAVSVGTELDMTTSAVDKGIRAIKPVSGRMQHLNGLSGALILDDTYNASPEAVIGALDTLYRMNASQKIAILGNMNELGEYSEKEHKRIGEYCDPHELSFLATIGPDANKYLAPAAAARGCLVKTFDNPIDVGKFVKERLRQDTVVLVKGSQNGVYAEEAIKPMLALPADSKLLVRQSRNWMRIKNRTLPKPLPEVKHVKPKLEHTEEQQQPPKQPAQPPQAPEQAPLQPQPQQPPQPPAPPPNNSGA